MEHKGCCLGHGDIQKLVNSSRKTGNCEQESTACLQEVEKSDEDNTFSLFWYLKVFLIGFHSNYPSPFVILRWPILKKIPGMSIGSDFPSGGEIINPLEYNAGLENVTLLFSIRSPVNERIAEENHSLSTLQGS